MPAGPASERAAGLAGFTEDAVLLELRAALPGVAIPADFEALFRHGAERRPRFLDLFGAFFSEQIKAHAPVRAILTEKLLARVEGLAIDATEILYRIETQFGAKLDAIKQDTSALLRGQAEHTDRLARIEAMLARVEADKNVPLAPLRAILLKLDAAGVADHEIPDRLDKAADELIRLREDLARLRNDRPEFAAFRSKASALIDLGEFDAARAVLRDGRMAARALREEISRSEAGFLLDEARIDLLQLRYEAARTNFEEAVRLDPGNCWAWIELGDLWTVLGSLAEAKKAFASALTVAAASGPDRDLSVSHNKIGDVQQAQGDLAAALTSYQASHEIFERLAKADPGNAGWQRDLSVSHNKIGEVQQAQGDLAAALTSYQASHEIFERLAKADPGNAGWQRDLALSYGRVALINMRQGNPNDGLDAFRQGRDIIARLIRRSPDNATLPKDLAWFETQMNAHR